MLNDRLSSRLVRAISGDDESLWVGTIEGVSRIDAAGRVRNIGIADGLPGTIVFAFSRSRDGGMWVATLQGVAKVKDNKVSVVEQTRGADTRSLYEDEDGRLWIGMRSGLHCLRAGVFDACGTAGLTRTSVFAFHPDKNGDMWLGTSVGLMRVHGRNIVRYTERAGFYGDAVFTILDDENGNFWLSSNRGIARLSLADIEVLDRDEKAQIEPSWYGKNDGMLSQQGNGASQTPGWRATDGRMWIGTSNGVVIVDPKRQRSNVLRPPVAIERMLVNGKDVDLDHVARIGPGVDRIELHYAGMSYVAPAAVRYRYRIEGFDRDWVEAGASRVAYYTNLPAGNYEFHAIASNNDGVWNEEGASLRFTIVPSWYETVWFRTLIGLVVFCLLVSIYQLRVMRLRKRERALTHEVAFQTEALRNANEELQRLASLDGLTRIANRGSFDERLEHAWLEHARRGLPLAVLLCDIDAFKAYNDTYGHLAGDAALSAVAATLTAAARASGDIAARYGGEEFAVLLTGCTAAEAREIAELMLRRVRDLSLEHRASNAAACVTISVGAAVVVPDSEQASDSLVKSADDALYRAKARGRNCVCGPDEFAD